MRKKLIIALFAVFCALHDVQAQDGNMALGCHTSASSEEGAHTSDKAVDGLATGDSRWESRFDGVADADDQWWSVDLGTAREFDMIQIVWEGAYARAFRIEAANTSDFSDAVTILERNESLASLTRTYDLADAVTARYVRFVGIRRALPYGYSFYEFGVYKKASPVLTTLRAEPSAALCRVGGSISVGCTGTDQYGEPMAVTGVTYTISPADAGTFSGNVYTPSRVGTATVTARVGDVSAAAFDVVAYDGNNVASADKVVAANPEADDATMYLAFDGNEGAGEWILHGNTGDSEADRTYDAWFTLDLGKDYTVSMVSVCFEGASSEAYTVSFSSDGTTWSEAVAVSHPSGINAWTDRLGRFAADASSVRYVRFASGRAATQYGVKVREFSVYGRAVDGELTMSPQPDAATGAWVLDGELNAVTAAFFDEASATAYDLRGVTVAAPIVISALNPNTMFIVTETQRELLSGTPNLVVATDGGYVSHSITLTDGYDVNTAMSISAAEVTYRRAAATGLQTLVLPFSASVPAAMRAYVLVDRTSAGILFQETSALTAGTPCLLSGDGELSLTATDALLDFTCIVDRGDEAAFTGTYAALTAATAGGAVYVLDGEGMFRRATASATIPAFRAWLTATDGSFAKLHIVFDGATDGISAASVTPAPAASSAVYTVGGIKTGLTAKGIMVRDGKKIIVK